MSCKRLQKRQAIPKFCSHWYFNQLGAENEIITQILVNRAWHQKNWRYLAKLKVINNIFSLLHICNYYCITKDQTNAFSTPLSSISKVHFFWVTRIVFIQEAGENLLLKQHKNKKKETLVATPYNNVPIITLKPGHWGSQQSNNTT